MAKTSIKVDKDGLVTTDPVDFGAAIKLIEREKHRGLWVRPDFANKSPGPPIIDLSLLQRVTFLDEFGIADLPVRRVTNFEGIYELTKPKKLALHTYPKLDLSRFPDVESLFLTDAPGMTGLEALSQLRYARLSKLRADDLSFLSGMRRLAELWIIHSPNRRLQGIDASPSLGTLQIEHCAKLETVDGLPNGLLKLKILKCGRLKNLSFLAKHPCLEFLYLDVMDDVAFVPSLRQLTYLGFENVMDGDLEPLTRTTSLRDANFYPENRKHYTHSKTQINDLLPARKRR